MKIQKRADELVKGDTVYMYGFDYIVARTEQFDNGKVGVWITYGNSGRETFDSVPADQMFSVT